MIKTRLEAFSDGVIAIIITIMVLELKVPHDASWDALRPVWPVFLSYLMSFVYVGIYWNNHHHMLHMATKINGRILWANLHLLFWLSLFPFCSGWLGENHFAPAPASLYGVVLFMASFAYLLLEREIVLHQGEGSKLRKAIGNETKGKISSALYLTAAVVAFYNQWIAIAIYVGVAFSWLVPDRRIEEKVN